MCCSLNVGGNPDYSDFDELITFPVDASNLTITVDIQDDMIFESSEAFTITMSDTGGDTEVVVEPNVTTVEIIDDDSKSVIIFYSIHRNQ